MSRHTTKKALLVTLEHSEGTGAKYATTKLKEVLCENVSLDVFSMDNGSRYKRALCLLSGLSAGLTPSKIIHILRQVESYRYDVVILNSSLFGVLAVLLKLRFPKVRLVVYFHNLESKFLRTVRNGFGRYALMPVVWLNEKLSITMADSCWFISERERQVVERFLGRVKLNKKLTGHVPPFVQRKSKILEGMATEQAGVLFVGSDFPPNVEALRFLNKVHGDSKLPTVTAIGRGLEKYQSEFENIEVIGFVDELSPFYQRALVVVAPIFNGAGLKTKLIEAVEYGKLIVLSEHAFSSIEGVFTASGPFFVFNSTATYLNQLKHALSSDRKYYDPMDIGAKTLDELAKEVKIELSNLGI